MCHHGDSFNSRAHGGRDPRLDEVSDRPEFQFTRPRGARPSRARRKSAFCSFNSRAHGGRDHNWSKASLADFVSIHAPTGGATSSDPETGWEYLFQFTRPRGARPPSPAISSAASSFNSRAHGGRDLLPQARKDRLAVSIHAPTGGATCRSRSPARTGRSFNSRAPGGRDSSQPSRRSPTRRFNSRAHGGRDGARGKIGKRH